MWSGFSSLFAAWTPAKFDSCRSKMDCPFSWSSSHVRKRSEDAMIDLRFGQPCPVAIRIAGVQAAVTAARYGLQPDEREDLQQEALLELWSKRTLFDARRGSWRTFAERIVRNRMTSRIRSQ